MPLRGESGQLIRSFDEYLSKLAADRKKMHVQNWWNAIALDNDFLKNHNLITTLPILNKKSTSFGNFDIVDASPVHRYSGNRLSNYKN